MRSWAVLDNQNKVLEIITSNERPLNSVKITENTICKIGYLWNGWEFKAPKYTAFEFLLRFTSQERMAFRAAAVTDPVVADFQQLAGAAQEVETDNPITIAGMNYLVSVGLLTEQRKNEILS